MALYTERFILEPLGLEHAEALYNMRSFPEIYKWTSTGRWHSIADSQAWIIDKLELNNAQNYIVTLAPSTPVFFKTEGVPRTNNGNYTIASIGVIRDGEIGYIVHPAVWGFGVAKESVRAMIKSWFERYPEEQQIKADIDATNTASLGVLKKMGFVEAGREDYVSPEMGKGILVTWVVKRETVELW